MFTIIKQVVSWEDSLYVIKRIIKEDTFPPDFAQEYKEYLCADMVLKKNGLYYFVEKIDEAQIVTEDTIELTES